MPGKDIVRPYDVSSWTLPLMMGVERRAHDAALARSRPGSPRRPRCRLCPWTRRASALAPGSPETFRLVNAGVRGGQARIARAATSVGGREWPAGTVFLDPAPRRRPRRRRRSPASRGRVVPAPPADGEPLRAPRVGVYKPWLASMDEGWTRFVLEQYGFEPKTLDNKAVRAGLAERGLRRDRAARRDEGSDRHRQAAPRRGRDALLPGAAAPSTRAGSRRRAPRRSRTSSRRAARSWRSRRPPST